jgi:hypothetical protein
MSWHSLSRRLDLRRVRELSSVVLPSSFSTIAAALVPKCPICLAALLSAIGISLPVSNSVLLSAGALLLVPVGLLCSPAGGARRAAPLLLGCGSALLIVYSKSPGAAAAFLPAGLAGLSAAFLWKGLVRRKPGGQGGCCHLASAEDLPPAAREVGPSGEP